MGCKGKKRKLFGGVISSLVLMFVCGVTSAQSYPPEFAGAMFNGSTLEIPVEMCLTSIENLPYSVPDPPPCDESFWYGTFIGHPQASELALYFFIGNGRIVCSAPSIWRERIFPWNPDMQAYARLAANPETPWVVSFEVITIDWSFAFGTYREGVFVPSGHPPVWWVVSEDYALFEYNISPSDMKADVPYTYTE